MDQDQPFRIALTVGLLLVVPFALYHRLKSQATREKLDRWQEGALILFTLRPIGIAGMLGLVAFVIDPWLMSWSALPLPDWLRWSGIGVGVLAGALLVWTFRSLGKNLTDTVVTRKQHTLVTSGPYRWVRHPFYVVVALSFVGNALAAANWFIFLSGALALGLIVMRTRIEEEKLLERFGDEYRAYRQRTGRFFPRFGAG
jgi:protein-S-isoprenylcysteine O-methyltransferase Ste14